jgi:hypothetical protein
MNRLLLLLFILPCFPKAQIYTEVSQSIGINHAHKDLNRIGGGSAFFDYNNDSYSDLFVANGQIPMPATFCATYPEDPNKFYQNNGDGTFTVTSDYLGMSSRTIAHGMAYVDNDGDIDFVVRVIDRATPSDSMPHSLFYQNDATSNNYNWVQVKLERTISNRDAFGAHVLVYAAERTFLREVGGGSNHAPQNSSVQYIGLQNITQVDSIIVKWPNTGSQIFHKISINQRHTFIEGQFNALSSLETDFQFQLYPNPTSQQLHIELNKKSSTPFDIILSNILGRIVYEQKNCSQQKITLHLDTLKLSPGIYFLKINRLKAKNILHKGI